MAWDAWPVSIFSDDLEAKGLVEPVASSGDDDAPPSWLQPGPTKKKSIFAADLEAKGLLDTAPTKETRPLKNTGPDLQGQLDSEAKAVPMPFADAKKRIGESFSNVGSTLSSGASAIATGVAHPIDTVTDPSRRHELERGLDDVLTLGQVQKLAARIGNAMGDVKRGTSLNETKSFSANPTAGDTSAPSNVEAYDASQAPGFRAAGNLAGMMLPSIPAAAAGKAASLIPGTGALAAGARGVAAYEGMAIPAAAAQAPEGHVLESIRDAATDPAGLALSGGIGLAGRALGKAGERIADRIDETKGAKARRLIEDRGRGAEVSLASPGKGGVFDAELAGIPNNDQAIGTAAQRGGEALVNQIKEDHRVETSRPYKALKAQIDATPMSREMVDVTPIVTNMMDAVDDLGTHPAVRAQLKEQLAILEKHRATENDPVQVSQEQLNALRGTLMKMSKVGTTDAPAAREAPLRAAAFAAKDMVDEGPYARLNELYAEGAQRTAARRKLLGLAKKAPADENIDFNKARLNIQRGEAETNSATGGAFTDRIRELGQQNPAYQQSIDLPALTRARNDLTFGLAPHHGGLISRAGGEAVAAPLTVVGMITHPIATSLALGAANIKPIQGRVLAPLADTLRSPPTANPAAVARLIQAARQPGVTRAQLQAQADRDGVQPEIAANIAASQGY